MEGWTRAYYSYDHGATIRCCTAYSDKNFAIARILDSAVTSEITFRFLLSVQLSGDPFLSLLALTLCPFWHTIRGQESEVIDYVLWRGRLVSTCADLTIFVLLLRALRMPCYLSCLALLHAGGKKRKAKKRKKGRRGGRREPTDIFLDGIACVG